MKITLKMPKLGMAMQSALISRWLKSEGQPVNKGEPLLEIETEKVETVVESPFNGTLMKILAESGKEVPIGTAIAEIEGNGSS